MVARREQILSPVGGHSGVLIHRRTRIITKTHRAPDTGGAAAVTIEGNPGLDRSRLTYMGNPGLRLRAQELYLSIVYKKERAPEASLHLNWWTA